MRVQHKDIIHICTYSIKHAYMCKLAQPLSRTAHPPWCPWRGRERDMYMNKGLWMQDTL